MQSCIIHLMLKATQDKGQEISEVTLQGDLEVCSLVQGQLQYLLRREAPQF